MPVGEERAVSPISLSDGTLLFMHYKYPLRQAFGGVLAEPIMVLHEGGVYRVRYESRDGEGRDRLGGARPIVTRDWKRSKWLNEFLVGLDELRLMASLGGRGGPENELYRILSNPKYREQLACYASKFPDESGSRLIILNWVGPVAGADAAKVAPAGTEPRATVVPPGAPRVSVEPASAQKANIEPPAREQPSTVIPLAHQVTPDPPAPSPEASRASVEPDVAPLPSPQVSVEDAGSQKVSLRLDSTQPVPVQSPTASQAGDVPEAAQPPLAGPPAASQVDVEPTVTQRTRVDRPATDQPSTVIPLAHQVNPDPPAASPEAPRAAAEPSIEQPLPIEQRRTIEHQQSIVPSAALHNAGRSVRSSNVGRPGAAEAVRAPSRPSLLMIAGVVVVGISLLLAGWWLRGTSDRPIVASSPPETPAKEGAIGSVGVADPDLDAQVSSPQGSPVQDDVAEGTAAPGKEAPEGEAKPPRDVREQPEKEAADEVQVASSDPKPTPPAPVAIDSPLLAQGGEVEASPPPSGVQNWGGGVSGGSSIVNGAGAQESRVSAVAVPVEATTIVKPRSPSAPDGVASELPRNANVSVQQSGSTLKITSAQMNPAQRKYLARVIRFLEPPLKYEWTPKFTRSAFFTSLVTDGEPPECLIDFKEPTTITFDLIIRGGSGTESRIEDVEVIY